MTPSSPPPSLLIVNSPDRVERWIRQGRVRLGGAELQAAQSLEGDANAEVEGRLPHGIAKVFELEVLVAAGVDDQDETAAPADHLVEAEVLEMASVRQIDVGPGVGGPAEHLRQQRSDGPGRPIQLVAFLARAPGIPQPPSEPNVEESQQEGQGRRGVIAHVGAGCRAGNRHRRAQRDAILAPVLAAVAIAEIAAPGMQRGDREGFCLALLPRELVGRSNIEGDVDDMERPPVARLELRPRPASGRLQPQPMHAQVIVVVEAGEGIGLLPVRVGSRRPGTPG